MKKLTWIVFDADDTLLDFQGAQAQAFRLMMDYFGYVNSEYYLKIYRELNEGLWRSLERGEISKEELIEKRFRDFCQHCGLAEPHEEMRFIYERELSGRGDLLPGAWEISRSLSENYPLAIASNGISYIQKARLSKSGLEAFFKKIIISEDTGFEKPQRGFFDAMMYILGEEDPSRVLFVGDSLSSDMLGALNYGLISCWYNPADKTTDLPLDYSVNSLEQLSALVDSLII